MNSERTERSYTHERTGVSHHGHGVMHEIWEPPPAKHRWASNLNSLSASENAKKENDMFKNPFSFDSVPDIYAKAVVLTEQMTNALHKPDAAGDGKKGVEYGGAVGHKYGFGELKESKVYAHPIEAGNTTNPSFLNELKDLLLQGAVPSDTWHSHPNIKGYDANLFSKEDIEQANVFGVNTYILTPAGQVFEYKSQRMRPYQESDRYGHPFGYFNSNGNFVLYKEQRPGEYGPPKPGFIVFSNMHK